MTHQEDNQTGQTPPSDDLLEKIKKAQEASDQREEENATDDFGPDTEIENLRSELEKMNELAKRTMADFQNFKRRQEEENARIMDMANLALLKRLLPILDNFERAKDEWSEGIGMCVNQFKKTMEDVGVEEIKIDTEEGTTDFDPELHEALLHANGPKDKVVEVLEKGYKIGDRVLRHAKVKVGNGE